MTNAQLTAVVATLVDSMTSLNAKLDKLSTQPARFTSTLASSPAPVAVAPKKGQIATQVAARKTKSSSKDDSCRDLPSGTTTVPANWTLTFAKVQQICKGIQGIKFTFSQSEKNPVADQYWLFLRFEGKGKDKAATVKEALKQIGFSWGMPWSSKSGEISTWIHNGKNLA